MKHATRRICALLLAVFLAVAGACTSLIMTASASPDEGGRVPYRFHLETLHTTGAGGSMIQVVRKLELELGQPLEAAGWLATDEGVSAYQYLWLPAGGGFGEWITVKNPHITHRHDLTAAGIEYPSGHSTAGFQFTIEPPKDLPEGYYDIYIRALDGMGTPCDLAAILDLRYGDPDRVSVSGQSISFPRIGREGEASLLGGATVEDDTLRLPPDGRVRLGDLNLTGFEEVKITYYFPDARAWKGDKTSILGLKSSGEYSYGKEDESYNVTHSLVHAPLWERAGQITLKLTECDENGDIWLTGHLNSEIVITAIDFVGKGYGTDRVAALINLSGETATPYLRSFSHTEAKTVTDPHLGEVLRLEVKDATNDPYAHFAVGDLLRDHDIVLDADVYKFLVLLYRAEPVNNTDRMNLYLCSGPITGATEECNQGATLLRDGKWHYLLVDLTQKANWGGIVNGWRFDYISGDSDAGDAVEFASVQFFRTAKAAHEAAQQDPTRREAYKSGDPVVLRDMREEGSAEEEFIPDPSDTYEVTEPPTEPPIEPPTEPAPTDTEAPDSETITSPNGTEELPTKRGCASAVSSFSLLALLSPLPLWLKKRKILTYKGENHET